MQFSHLEYFLWILISLGEVGLLIIVIGKRLWRQFPFFSAYTFFAVFRELAITASSHSSPENYFYSYYALSLIGTGIMLFVICELAIAIFRPVAYDCRAAIKVGLVLAIAAATWVCAWSLHVPIGLARNLPAIVLRSDLLLTCLRFVSFAAVAACSRIIGLHWRHHVFGIAAGLGIYSCVDLIATTAYTQSPIFGAFAVHQVSKLAYLVSILAWCYILHLPEPAIAPLTPEVRPLLENLKSRLEAYQRIMGVREQ